jgi:L-lactate dehydrogenase complex protein LldE
MGLLGTKEKGTAAVRVALFITCFNDTLFPETGQATVEVLERLGVEVDFPYAQTCCGQMHFNTGYQREAIPLVRRFVEIFGGYEAIVAPSGSCVSMVRELYPMAADLAGDGRLAEQVEELGPKVFELSEFLLRKLGVSDVGAYYPHRVTYHPTCHSLRMLRIGDAPLELLRNVRGIDLVELSEAEECSRMPRVAAGSAGPSRSRTRTPPPRCSRIRSGASSTPRPRSAQRGTTLA